MYEKNWSLAKWKNEEKQFVNHGRTWFGSFYRCICCVLDADGKKSIFELIAGEREKKSEE